MSRRIVVFGATGYTGRLTAQALVARGERPVLAGRDPRRLRAVADRLGGLDVAVADVTRPGSVHDLVGVGDVLVSTVGPFVRYGLPALEAAVRAGAWYLDSTGEPPFVRRVFEEYGPRAAATGAGLVTGFGYDYVPGNLAGALALAEAGPAATRVDVGYFVRGNMVKAASAGTRASLLGVLLAPMYTFRDGAIVTERGSARLRAFPVAGRAAWALSIGATEQFSLPRLYPGLREAHVYLGWFGPATRAVHALARLTPLLARIPGVPRALEALSERAAAAPRREPDPSGVTSYVVAVASDAAGRRLGQAVVTGGDPYTCTARVLAWGAAAAARTGLAGTGALGPVEAFGLAELEKGCAEAGLCRFDDGRM